MKRPIAILLCLAMLFAALPLSASAAKEITSVSITGIPFPMPGQHPCMDSSVLISGDPELYTAEFFQWYCYEPLTTSSTFVKGLTYHLYIQVTAKPGVRGLDMESAQTMKATFNGRPARFWNAGGNSAIFELDVLCSDYTMVNSVNVNGLKLPAIGQKAIGAEDLLVPEGSGYEIIGAEWYRYDVNGRGNHELLPEDLTFEEHRMYFLAVYLLTDEGLEFGPDPQTTFDGWGVYVNDNFSGLLADDLYRLCTMPLVASNGFTVTYDPDPSMGGYVGVTETKVYSNSLEFQITDLPIPVTDRENLRFAGWYLEGSNIPVNSETVFSEDTALHAKWVEGTPLMYFGDVAENAWYYDDVSYCHRRGLMNGISDVEFAPDNSTTRAMIVTILNRMEGTPVSTEPNPFRDVEARVWYTRGVLWAQDSGIVTGYGNGRFGPNDEITREQLATILYRYYGVKGYDLSASAELSAYPDAGDVSAWAADAMRWAVGAGIISGVASEGETCLKPKGSATRAMVSAMLRRCINSVHPAE